MARIPDAESFSQRSGSDIRVLWTDYLAMQKCGQNTKVHFECFTRVKSWQNGLQCFWGGWARCFLRVLWRSALLDATWRKLNLGCRLAWWWVWDNSRSGWSHQWEKRGIGIRWFWVWLWRRVRWFTAICAVSAGCRSASDFCKVTWTERSHSGIVLRRCTTLINPTSSVAWRDQIR